MEYVYLDSNAIWTMKENASGYDKEFRETIWRIRPRYKTPFSEAHLLDIRNGIRPGGENYIGKDIDFLQKVSELYGVILHEGCCKPPPEFYSALGPTPELGLPWIVQGKVKDISAEYDKISCEIIQEPQIYFQGSSHEINLNKIGKSHPFWKILQVAQGIYSPETLKEYLKILWDGRDSPEVYRNFRQAVAESIGRIGAKDSLIGPDVPHYMNCIKAFLLAMTPCEIGETLYDATSALCQLRGQRMMDLRWPEKLVRAYHLLDFHPESWEPINKRNRPHNMQVDAKHLIYAAGARHLVTEDKSFYSKAKITFSSFGIKTNVSSIAEFKRKFD